jgi:hypothetical protein
MESGPKSTQPVLTFCDGDSMTIWAAAFPALNVGFAKNGGLLSEIVDLNSDGRMNKELLQDGYAAEPVLGDVFLTFTVAETSLASVFSTTRNHFPF